jgi:hypothetical protein
MTFAGHRSNDDGYWMVAPWFLLGGIVFSVVTFSMALVSANVYSKVDGNHREKQVKAAGVLLAMIFVLATFGYIKWVSKQSDEEFLKRERALAEKYVLEHVSEELKSHGITDGVRVSGSTYEAGPDKLPVRYHVYATGAAENSLPPFVFVVLAVKRPARELPVFTFLCTTKLSLYAMDQSKSPCAQGQ